MWKKKKMGWLSDNDKYEPSEHSVLCSNHFEEDCFEQETQLLHWKKKTYLRVDAVPIIQLPANNPTSLQ